MRWRTRLLWGALVWTGVASAQKVDGAGEAAADEPVRLEWNAPEGCPGATEVLAAVRLPPEAPGRLRAQATVVAEGGGYHLTLSTEQGGQKGRRELVAADCGELAEVTAALLSLALHSSVGNEPVRREPDPPPVASPTRAPRPSVHAELGVRGAVGALPRPSAGPVVRLTLRREALRFDAGVFGLAAARDRVSSPGASYYHMWAGTLGSCLVAGSRVVWGGCLGLDSGFIGARSEGVTEPGRSTRFWLSPAAALLVGIEQDAWTFSLRPGISVPLIRPSFEIRPYGSVFQPSVVVGSAEVVLGARF